MPKHDSLRNLDRNQRLVICKDADPRASWAAIGAQFGITRQRAQAIYASMKRRDKCP